MSKNLAVSLVKEFKASGIRIPKLQFSSIGGLSFAAAYEGNPTTVMVNEAAAGMDFDPDLAVCKALVEYLERAAFLEGIENRDPICRRLHSDGVAAFPRSMRDAPERARQNAYFEALERYVWASWWDDKSIGHTAVDLLQSGFGLDSKVGAAFEKFQSILPLDSTIVLEPAFEGADKCVIILFSKLRGHGYITGGAAGPANRRTEIFVRAMSELFRHGLAMKRFLTTKTEPATFYEKRLLYFGLGHGNHLVTTRLTATSKQILLLPALEIDSQLKSRKTDPVIFTHRCLFFDCGVRVISSALVKRVHGLA